MKSYPLSSNCCNWIFAAARMLSFKGEWLISYDFTYNSGKSLEHIGIAKNKISEAEQHLKKNELSSFVLKLSDAFKIIILAILVLNNSKLSFKTNIREANDLFRAYAENGNIDIKYSEYFNKLITLTKENKATIKNSFLSQINGFQFLEITKELAQHAEQLLKAIQSYRSGPGGMYIEK
jgi:hypothetical protein